MLNRLKNLKDETLARYIFEGATTAGPHAHDFAHEKLYVHLLRRSFVVCQMAAAVASCAFAAFVLNVPSIMEHDATKVAYLQPVNWFARKQSN